MSDIFQETISREIQPQEIKTDEQPRDLVSICKDIFEIVIRMRQYMDLGEPESLMKLLKHYIAAFENNAREIHLDSEKTQQVKYALVALLDETIMSLPGTCQQFWLSNPLQLGFFGEINAGKKFFEFLRHLMADPSRYVDVLEVYFMCLTLGFEGEYADNQPQKENILRTLAKTLLTIKKQQRKTQHRSAPAVYQPSSGRTIPLWAVALVVFGLIVIGWLSASMATGNHTNQIISEISVFLKKNQ